MSWLDIVSFATIGVVLILIDFTISKQLVARRNTLRGNIRRTILGKDLDDE